jgi:hypothetical protein
VALGFGGDYFLSRNFALGAEAGFQATFVTGADSKSNGTSENVDAGAPADAAKPVGASGDGTTKRFGKFTDRSLREVDRIVHETTRGPKPLSPSCGRRTAHRLSPAQPERPNRSSRCSW